jgi:hypothetical protein
MHSLLQARHLPLAARTAWASISPGVNLVCANATLHMQIAKLTVLVSCWSGVGQLSVEHANMSGLAEGAVDGEV